MRIIKNFKTLDNAAQYRVKLSECQLLEQEVTCPEPQG